MRNLSQTIMIVTLDYYLYGGPHEMANPDKVTFYFNVESGYSEQIAISLN